MSQTASVGGDGRLAGLIGASVHLARSARDRLRARAQGAGAVVTPLGWGVLVTVAASFALGYTLGWIELVAIGWVGLVLAAAALAHLIGRSAYDIRLSLPRNRVVVGEDAAGQVKVVNPTRRRLPGVRMEIPISAGQVEFTAPSLPRAARFDERFVVPTPRRGVIPVGPARTIRGDPLGLFRKEIVWQERIDLFVHPRTIPIPSMSTGLIRDLEGSPTRDLTSSDVSFHALREYVPGDELRTVHWKSTAKTGTYMVRQFEESRRSHLMVVLGLAESDFAAPDEFEMAVSVAGSLGARAIRDGRSVTVATSEVTSDSARPRRYRMRELSTVTRGRLLDDLTAVEPASHALPLMELAKLSAERVLGMSLAFLVCGSAVTLTALRAAAARFPAGVEVVAVVCDPEAVPRLRRVAGLSVLTIGYLEDLQAALEGSARA